MPLAPPSSPPRARLLLLVVGPASDATELSDQLVDQAVDVMMCGDAGEALLQAGSHRPDAVLAAATLPDVTGALVRVLSRSTGIPVLLGVGDGDGEQAASALTGGALACVARPYRALEVLRILRALRPVPSAVSEPPLQVGALRVDPAALQVQLYGRHIALPPREFRLLHLLMTHADRIVTREQIRAAVWGATARDASNTITVHVQRLRARIGDDPQQPTIIHTVRRVGYRLVPPPPQRTARRRLPAGPVP